MTRNLVTSVLLYETVRTTKKRADVAAPVVERLIAIAKRKVPREAIRAINRVVTHRNASRKMMEVLKDRYKDRPSGFTRMVALGSRKGDGAMLVELCLLDGEASGQRSAVSEQQNEKRGTSKRAASKSASTK